uniref:Calmodulin binding transcription activator 1 n=1 Tax=Oncorhynchus mykiss TaxID=8022 RepID=A0A8C7UMK4_ONCMY
NSTVFNLHIPCPCPSPITEKPTCQVETIYCVPYRLSKRAEADEHGHLKIYLPKKLLECLPKCSSLPKERHRWNTNEV